MTHSSLCLPFIILSVLKIRIDLLLSPVCSVLSHTLKKQSKDSNENSFILLMKRNLYAFVLAKDLKISRIFLLFSCSGSCFPFPAASGPRLQPPSLTKAM